MPRHISANQTVSPPQLRSSLPYLAALDGLRALAILAVLLYHTGINWAQGGFLGVEVFFVVSGYLITTLLLNEFERKQRIALGVFWQRRVRRLLPASCAVIVSVLTFAVLFLPSEVARLRGDALAAFFYLTNWLLIYGQRSYFEATARPSLLQHFWSLAVEGQFYLLWPPIVVLALRWRRCRWLLIGSVLGVCVSALLMATLFQPGVDPSRIYYGSDTRAAGFLLGAVLALIWQPDRWSKLSHLEGRFLTVAGMLGLLNIGWFCWHVHAYQAALFRGGFLWVALATAVVIAAVVQPYPTLLTSLLGSMPLRYLGRRSYSIYLWHWPVFLVIRPQIDQPFTSVQLLPMRLLATLALAELSFHLVEQPFRHGLLEQSWADLSAAYTHRRWQALVRALGVAITVTIFFTTLGWMVFNARHIPVPAYLAVSTRDVTSKVLGATQSAKITRPHAQPRATLPAPPTQVLATAAATFVPTPVTLPTPMPPRHILAIGDSVMLGAAGLLTSAASNIEVDAAVSRQAQTGSDLLLSRRDQGTLGDIVVIQLGNNGPLDQQQFDAMLATVQSVPRVLVLTVRVPRPWEASNNAIIQDSVARYANAVLVDWYAASAENYSYFWDDGLHLRPEGAAAYTSLVLAHLGE